MSAAFSTMSSCYSNAGFSSLRTLRLCGKWVQKTDSPTVWHTRKGRAKRQREAATRSGNRNGNQKRKKEKKAGE
ncbi:MAG: hypothetical protein WAN11_24910 [Syntrophobacteraceae bacterium]